MNFKRSITISIIILLTISCSIFLNSKSVEAKSSNSDIVKIASESIGKHPYNIKSSLRKSSNSKKAIIKKYHLRKYTIPKKFRGNWYWKNSRKAHITAKKIQISGLVNETSLYRGSDKLNNKLSLKGKMYNNIMLVWPYQKHSLRFSYAGSQPSGFTLGSVHGHKVLWIGMPARPFYRSKALANKYGLPHLTHDIVF